jgi:hypothetical protein
LPAYSALAKLVCFMATSSLPGGFAAIAVSPD